MRSVGTLPDAESYLSGANDLSCQNADAVRNEWRWAARSVKTAYSRYTRYHERGHPAHLSTPSSTQTGAG